MGLYLGKKKVALVFKKECSGSDVGGVVNTEDITVTPTTSQQVVKRSSGKYINQVTVNAIPTEEKTATTNGDVTPTSGKFLTKVTVNVPTPAPVLQEKTATENGEVVPDEGYDGLSKVTVNVASSGGGVDRLQWKCDNIKSLYYEFYNYSGESLDEIFNGLDISQVTNMRGIFRACKNLTSIPLLDTSNVTNMREMFQQNEKITSIPLLDTSNVTDMGAMFYYCFDLIEIPPLDTRNVTDVGSMFNRCGELVTVPLLDMIKVTTTSVLTTMFYDCKKLTNLTLKNIKVFSLQIGSGTSWGHLLTDESLINTAKELWEGSSSRTLTVSTPSNARFDEIYVKLITATEEMIAEDPYINNKKPCVVCESTDEGAMTLREYVVSKNWTLAM